MISRKRGCELMENNKISADELWSIAFTYIKTIVDTMREAFLILDKELRIISANKNFYSFFQVTQKQTEGEKIYNLGNGQWNIPKLKILLENILPKNTYFENFKVDHNFPKIGHKMMMLNARQIFIKKDEKPILLLAIEDVTKQLQLENKMKKYTKELMKEVAKRTDELSLRVKELERMNKIMVGRELKMIELKDKIKELKKS